MLIRFSSWLSLLVLLWTFPTAAQQSENDLSAWSALVQRNPDLVDRVSLLEMEILQLMSVGQARAYMSGVSSAEIVLMTRESLETFLLRKGIVEFDISWYSIDGGGTSASSGGVFQLNGTVGQPDAGVMIGGEFKLTGGFWAITKSGEVFEDGFESGSTSSWSETVGG